MIFKTYENDLDGISNKLGFSKRSFAEWGTQVKTSFNEGTTKIEGFKKALTTAFIAPAELKEIKLIENENFQSVFGINADEFFNNFNKGGSKSVSTLTQFCENFKEMDDTMRSYLTDCMQKQVPASFDGYNKYVQSAINNNKQLTISTKAANLAMKGLAMAGNMIAMWAISEVIGGVINYLDELSHKAQNIAEEAESKFSESNEQNETYKENIKSLGEYKQKYQEILNSNDSEIDKRKSLLELQGNINKLVGTQCEGLDLVNGKLDDQITKIEKITKSQKEQYYQNSVGNYTNAKRAANSSTGQVDKDGVTKVYEENNPDKDLVKILQENGYGDLYSGLSGSFFAQLFSLGNSGGSINMNDGIDAYGNVITSLEDRVAYLKKLQEVLLKNGKGDSGLYGAVTSQIQKWEDSLKSQKSSAEDVIKSYIDLNANPENINSVDDYKNYIDTFTGEIKKDKNVSQIIKDGVLNDEDIKTIVNDYISVLDGFSEWYDKWKKNNIEPDETDNLSGKSFNQIWNSLGTGTDEASKKVAEEKENLLKLAEAGQLTEEAFKNSSVADTFTKAGYSIEEATKKVNGFIENVKQLNSMKTGISAIISAYDEKKDASDKRVGSDTLNSMYDTLGVKDWSKPDLKVWEQYKEVASDSKSTLKDLKTAQDNLATSFVNSDNYLSNITEDTYDYYVGLLKEMGVTNAEEVATRALNQSKIDAKIATIDLAVATNGEVSSLANYITALDDSSNSLAYYTLQKQIANNNALDSSKSIENLKKLAEQCGITGEAIALMSSMAANMKQVEEYTTGSKKNDQHAGDVITNANSELTGQKKRLNKVIKQKVKTGVGTKIKTSGGNQDKKDKNSSSKDKSKSTQVIDWIERRLNRLNSTIDYTSAKLQNLFSIKAKSNNLNEQIKTSTKLINAYGIAATKYKAKANSVKLSGSLKKAVREGRLKGYSMKELIATYGEKPAEKITKYQDYYDKYQDALKNKQDEIAKRRQYKIDKEQNYVDKADAKYNKNEALKENAKSASEKNTILKAERENLQKSYEHQIKIAKINKDKVEQARLNAELQKKLNDIAIEQHQNVVDELDRNNEALEAQKQNLKTASEKNSIVEQQKAIAQQTYAEQIEIAKLQYGVGSDEVKKLQEEQKSKLADFENEKFENIQTEYSNWLDMIQSRIDGLDGSISIVEAKGITATNGLYQGKVAIEKENLSTLKAEKAALEEQHKSTEVGTALWYSQEKSLNDVSTAIANAQKNMIEYRNSIREANDKVLELKKSFIDLGNIYLDNFEKYLSRYSLTDEDTGGLTDKGVATLGIYRKQSISAGEQQKIDMDKLNELEDIIARYNIYDDTQKKILLEANNYDSFEQVKEDYEKYAQAVQDDISNRISAEENIINLMKERYNAELAYIQKLIDDRKTQLSQEKDLYDYQKSIQEKVDNISLIQKQLDALRADGSEEAMAKRNVLQEQLDDAKEDLMDVEYDKYISDQQNMLDKLSEDYQNLIEDLLQDVDTLLNEGNEIAKNNGDKFEKAINGFTEKYGETPFTQQQIDVAAIKTAVEKEQKDQDAANEVLSAIEKIGTVDLNGEGRGRLVNAENLYKSLTDVQRKIVDENPNGLTLLQKKQQEWVALQAQTQTSIPTSQPSSTPQQSATIISGADKVAANNSNGVITKGLVQSLISKYGKKPKKKKTEYGILNQYVWSKTKGKKIIPNEYFDNIRSGLGLSKTASQNDIIEIMKQAGFSKGGIVETLSKVPGQNGDDGWATLKRGEAVLTPEQTKMFQNMVQVMPPFVNAMNTFTNIPSLSQAKITPNQQSISMGDLVLNLPNVTDTESFIKTIKTDTKVQKAIQQTVCDQLSGRGKLNIMKL